MKNIFAFLDRHSDLQSVCDHASWVANRLHAPLELIHLQADETEPLENDPDNDTSIATFPPGISLEQALARVQAAGVKQASILRYLDDWHEQIVEKELSTRFYVASHHELGHSYDTPSTLRPNLDLAIRTLHRPLLVAKSSFKAPHTFIVAIDGSQACRLAIRKLADSPLLAGLSCTVVTVDQEQKDLDWVAERFDDAGFRVDTHILSGEPVETLTDFAARINADLLAVGAYGHSGIQPATVGSTAQALMQESKIPVLIMR